MQKNNKNDGVGQEPRAVFWELPPWVQFLGSRFSGLYKAHLSNLSSIHGFGAKEFSSSQETPEVLL